MDTDTSEHQYQLSKNLATRKKAHPFGKPSVVASGEAGRGLVTTLRRGRLQFEGKGEDDLREKVAVTASRSARLRQPSGRCDDIFQRGKGVR